MHCGSHRSQKVGRTYPSTWMVSSFKTNKSNSYVFHLIIIIGLTIYLEGSWPWIYHHLDVERLIHQSYKWGFPKMGGTPIARCFAKENPIKMDDLGGTPWTPPVEIQLPRCHIPNLVVSALAVGLAVMTLDTEEPQWVFKVNNKTPWNTHLRRTSQIIHG